MFEEKIFIIKPAKGRTLNQERRRILNAAKRRGIVIRTRSVSGTLIVEVLFER